MTPCVVFDTAHSNGYSTVRWEGRTGLAHRKAYADANGLSRTDLDGSQAYVRQQEVCES